MCNKTHNDTTRTKNDLTKKLKLESELLEIKLQNSFLTEANRRNYKIFDNRHSIKKSKQIDAAYNGSFCKVYLSQKRLSNQKNRLSGTFNHDISIKDVDTFAVTSSFSWVYNFITEKYQGYAEGMVLFEYTILKSNLPSINPVTDLNLPYKLYLAAIKRVKDIPAFEYPKSYMDFIMKSGDSANFQANVAFKNTIRKEYVYR